MDQRRGGFGRLADPSSPELCQHQGGSDDSGAGFAGEKLLELCEPLLGLTSIDLRDRNACLDFQVFRIESRGCLELLQCERWFAVRHVGIAEQGQRRGIRRHSIEQEIDIFDRSRRPMLS